MNVAEVQKKRSFDLNEYLKSSKNKSLFIAAVTVIFFIIFMVFGVIPAYREVLSQNKENKLIKDTVALADKKVKDLKLLVAEKESKADVLSFFSSVFENRLNQANLIIDLFKYGEENQVSITNISFDEQSRSQQLELEVGSIPNVQYIGFTLEAEGSREDLLKYIKEIEDSRRIFNIINLTITQKTEEEINQVGEFRAFNLSAIVEYYYIVDTEDIPLPEGAPQNQEPRDGTNGVPEIPNVVDITN